MTKPTAMPEPIKTAVSKLKSAQMCNPNAVQHLIEEALAALQSAQPAEPEQSTRLRGGVPTEAQIVAAARTLNKLSANSCNVDEADQWALYGNTFRAEAKAALTSALTAAPQAPALDAGVVRDAGRLDLWCIFIPGPDDVYAAPSKDMAERMAACHNSTMAEYFEAHPEKLEHWGVALDEIKAQVREWMHSAEEHAEELNDFNSEEWLAAQPAQAGEPDAYLHDDGFWTAAKTDAGRQLNDRLLFAGSPKIGVFTTPPASQEQADAVMAHVHDLYAELGLKWGGNPFLAISRLKDNRASQEQAQQPALCDGGTCGIGGYCDDCPKQQPSGDNLHCKSVQKRLAVQQPSGGEVADAPERIWLQINADGSPEDTGYPSDHEGVTWCWRSIGGQEVEYVRADLAKPQSSGGEVAQWQKRHPMVDDGQWSNTSEPDAKWWRDNCHGWGVRALTLATKPEPMTEADTVQVFGVKDGKETLLGTAPMPPRMKAREIAREYFGHFEDDDGSDAERCFGAMEQLIEHIERSAHHGITAQAKGGEA